MTKEGVGQKGFETVLPFTCDTILHTVLQTVQGDEFS